jgi:hypothetical protein
MPPEISPGGLPSLPGEPDHRHLLRDDVADLRLGLRSVLSAAERDVLS